ncbi:MAG: CAP domain-containing protein [Desulfovibrio sp.]|jgi:uncharacterized protein YkwD|nr:CAP domain-containing protein [Desulfovibrio sp.]
MSLTKFALPLLAALLVAALLPPDAAGAGRTGIGRPRGWLMENGYTHSGATEKDRLQSALSHRSGQKSQTVAEQTRGKTTSIAQAGHKPGNPDKKTQPDEGKSRVLTYDAYGPVTVKPGTESREPAPPRPTGEVETDVLGRPVGPVRLYDPPEKPPLPENPAASAEIGRTLPQAAPLPASQAPPPPAAPLQNPPADPAPAPPLLEPYPSSPEGALFGQEQPFVPPTGPGPFGVPQPPREERTDPRPGVVPLEDTRPPGSNAPLVYIAPGHSPDSGSGLELPQQSADGNRDAAGDPSYPSYQELGPEASPGYTGDPQAGTGNRNLLLDLINAERSKGRMCGSMRMPPTHALRANPILMDAAQRHARDMTARRYFSSTTPEGITIGRRLTDAGYAWAFIAENLAHMGGGEEAVLLGWLHAESRCINLMDAEYFEAGIGHDPTGRNWVLTLAAPVP